jgi:phospholipid/cholesterol/gamma-HCH transport system permease protein
MNAAASPPTWRLDRNGPEATLHLAGDWIACENGVRSPAEVLAVVREAGSRGLRLEAGDLGRWDSALIVFLKMLRESLAHMPIDDAGLPETARRLLALAGAGAVAPEQVRPLTLRWPRASARPPSASGSRPSRSSHCSGRPR